MLCNDGVGPMITQACRQAGIAVPEEVAIVAWTTTSRSARSAIPH